jgi:hypothetical protein
MHYESSYDHMLKRVVKTGLSWCQLSEDIYSTLTWLVAREDFIACIQKILE